MHKLQLHTKTDNYAGNIKVEAFGLADFLADIEVVIHKGYMLDFKNSANYPTSYGSIYEATLLVIETPEEVSVVDVGVDSSANESLTDDSLQKDSLTLKRKVNKFKDLL